MIALDTNVLVRLLVQDDPRQTAIANGVLARLTRDNPALVTCVTLAELAWVLDRSYRRSRSEIGKALAGLLETSELVFENAEACYRAFDAYVAAGRGDFADALIAFVGELAGARETLTFDRAAAAAFGMRLLA